MLQPAALHCRPIHYRHYQRQLESSGDAASGQNGLRILSHPGFKFTVMSAGVLLPLMSVLLLSELVEEQRERELKSDAGVNTAPLISTLGRLAERVDCSSQQEDEQEDPHMEIPNSLTLNSLGGFCSSLWSHPGSLVDMGSY